MTLLARRAWHALLPCLAGGPAAAQPPPGRGGPPPAAAHRAPALPAWVPGCRRSRQWVQTRIREWFIANPYPVQALPPGIAKRCAPAGLARKLAPRPGCWIPLAGGSVLPVHAASGPMHDLLRDAARGR